MIDLGPATQDEMVLAFLKAELESPRFRGEYQIDRLTLIDSADLQSSSQNTARLEALQSVRGALVLADATWRRVALEKDDLSRLKYLNHPGWIRLSGGTRLVSDGAKNVDSTQVPNTNAYILAVANKIKTGDTYPEAYPELIAVVGEEEGADIILTEGHMRATAYVIAGWPGQIVFILGTSRCTHEWDAWYGQRAQLAPPPD
jgi:hypothetical protein